MDRKQIYMWLVAIMLSLTSFSGFSHTGMGLFPVDSLCSEISSERYSDMEIFDALVSELSSLSNDDTELQMVVDNATAYSAMMRMDYVRAVQLYRSVRENSECEIERLVADVGLMTICYRVSANRQFFDYRASALARIRRINEEYDILSLGDKERFNRAKVEYGIVSVCYFSNLAMYEESFKVLEYLERNMKSAEDRALRLYARMIIANSESDMDKRLSSLAVGIDVAGNNGMKWLEANYKLLLAIALRDNEVLELFQKEYPERTQSLLPNDVTAENLPYVLAEDAANTFGEYGDRYMMIEALAVQASCGVRLEKYDEALVLLSGAYDHIIEYYQEYYPDSFFSNPDSLFCSIDSGEGPVTNIDEGIYHIHECLLSICREASCAYAGVGDKEASYINRDIYLELLRTTRLNKQLESRISAIDKEVVYLKVIAVALFLLFAVLLMLLLFVHRRRLRREKSYSMQRKRLLKVCRMLLSSLPHNIDNKQQLFDAISAKLNEVMGNFSGKSLFVVSETACTEGMSYIDVFDIQYMNLTDSDKLTVLTEMPLDDDKRNLIAMLVPYIAVAIEEGLRLSDISEEREKVEEMKRASAIYLAGHKRENVLKRVSVSIVSGIRPFMDRISNELKMLSGQLPVEDCRRKLQYVSELTEKLDDLNVILERWIKTRQGELNLRIENFALADLFAIMEKNSKVFDSRGLTLMVKPTDSVIKADKALTLFMINTLVDNAAKFTSKGGCVVLESIEDDSFVEIAVTDTGIGMSQNDIDRILDSKVYDASLIGADNELMKPKSKGSGFGLMNCKGIIEKYRKTDPIYSVCSFDITSTKGSGSRFSFRLPKGFMRFLSLLLLLLPISVSAENDMFARLNVYADSVFMCNVEEKHEEAYVVAQEALDILNDYYKREIGGNDTLTISSGNAAEILWWRESLYPDSLKEDVFFNILDIRNEVAVASLALNKWDAYRYNNFIYSTLYRLVDEDNGIADRYSSIKQVANHYEVAIAFLSFLILLLLVYFVITFVRHNIIEKTNERLVLEMNSRLLNVATQSGRRTTQELAQDIVDELYSCMGETMRIKSVAMLLSTGKGNEQVLVEAPAVTMQGRAGIYMERVLDSGEQIVLPSGMERVMPLYAVNDGERMSVGVLEIVTERPLSDNEVVSLELVSNYLASVAYHSAVRVASGYMAIEELEDEAERISYEENRMHVQNMVMDNCLSVIKHETVYYPSRIRELAGQALSSAADNMDIVTEMRELMDYYSSVFGILSNCAVRELDSASFSLSNVKLSVLFENAKRYAERLAKKNNVGINVVCEKTDIVIKADIDLVDYLFEQLFTAALCVKKSGTLLLRAIDAVDVVKVELVDNRYEITSDEVAELFTPTKRNIGDDGGVNAMEYLVAKEIVRIHEDYTGKHGGRMEARSDVSGTVILFTLPK